MNRYFFEINIIGPHSLTSFAYTTIMTRIHGTMSQIDFSSVALSFPEWTPSKDSSTLGRRLLVVCDNPDVLHDFSLVLKMEDLISDHIITVSGIHPVPSEAEDRIFYRDRAADRYYKEDRIAGRAQVPFVTIKSKSNKQRFILRIGSKPVTERRDGPSGSYGIGDQRSVPVF